MAPVNPSKRRILEKEFAKYKFDILRKCRRYVPEKKLRKQLRSMRIRAVRCLYDINTPKSLDHIKRFRKYFRDKVNPPTISCFYEGHTRTSNAPAAQGYLGGNEIEINGFYAKGRKDAAELKRSIYHEMYHNSGYDHVGNVDYAYSCEEACFGKKLSKEARTSMAYEPGIGMIEVSS